MLVRMWEGECAGEGGRETKCAGEGGKEGSTERCVVRVDVWRGWEGEVLTCISR